MSLYNDKVDLLKQDGSKVEGLKASVQRGGIYLDSGSFVIETGDRILRHMSNGGRETYEVIDPGFYEGSGGIRANYQMKVRKLGWPEASRPVQHVTYHVSGHNARINQHSVDNSTNTVNIDERAINYLGALRSEVEALSLQPEDRAAATDILDAVQVQVESGKPKKAVVSALLSGLPEAVSVTANVASIVTSFLSIL